MEAVPKWKELHEKYREHGLRLVVVSTRDQEGACVNPGWNPDQVVCDLDGVVADAMQVGDELPAAFLWSWRGTLLVKRGHVAEVQDAVEEELTQLPRVVLDGEMDPSVRPLLRSELSKTDKVVVVADDDERGELAKIRRKSHELSYSSASACKVGEELAANSLVKARLLPVSSGTRLVVELYSAEKGCLTGSGTVFWNAERPEVAVAEAVSKLVDSLKVGVEMPGGKVERKIEEKEIGEKAEEWEFKGDSGVLVGFDSEPRGAVVLVDGRLLCQETPCSKTMAAGRHRVEMQKEKYVPVSEQVKVDAKTGAVTWKLTPDFGWLTVESTPSGLPVTVDGKPAGTTPLRGQEIGAGPHQVLVTHPSYYDKGKQIVLERGEREELELELSPRQGGLQVAARDGKGNDLKADVWLDGVKVGSTPYAGKVLIGGHSLVVTWSGATRNWEKTVEVKEKEVSKVTAEFAGARSDTTVWGKPAVEDEAGPEPGRETFYVGAGLWEGAVVGGTSESARTSFSGSASLGLRTASWMRVAGEIVAGFEDPNPLTLRGSAILDISSFNLRAGPGAVLQGGRNLLALHGSLGTAIPLSPGWYFDLSLLASFVPVAESTWVVPLEAGLALRFGAGQ